MNSAQRHTKVPKSRLLARKIRGPRVAIHPHSSACSDTTKLQKQQPQNNRSSIPPTAFWDQSAETSNVRRPSPQHLSSLTEDTFVPARVIDISELEEVTSCPIAIATTVDTLDEHHEEENDEENGGERDSSSTINTHSNNKMTPFQIMVYTSYTIAALAFICFIIAVAVVFSNRGESGDTTASTEVSTEDIPTIPTEVTPKEETTPIVVEEDPSSTINEGLTPPTIEEEKDDDLTQTSEKTNLLIVQAEYTVFPNGCPGLDASTFMREEGRSMREEVVDVTTSIANSILNEQLEEDVRHRHLAYYSRHHPASINQVFDQEQGLFVTSLIPIKLESEDNPALISDLVREEMKDGFEISCDINVQARRPHKGDPKSRSKPPPLQVQVGYTLSNDCGLNAQDILNRTETNMKQDLIMAAEAVVNATLDETFPQDDIQLAEQDPVTIDQVLNVETGCEDGVNCLYISSTISVENYGDEPAVAIDTIQRGMEESFEEFTFFDELSDDTLECLLEDDETEQILEDDSEEDMTCTADDPTCPQGLHCRLHEGEGCIESAIGVCVEPPSPRCPRIYRLVCGCDGNEYSNSCLAYHKQAANGALFSGYTMGGC